MEKAEKILASLKESFWKSARQYARLAAVLLFLLFSLALLTLTRTTREKENCAILLDAANRAEAAFAAIRDGRLARGHEISLTDDPNATGLIGDSYTEITTTLGSLEAKRSAANPDNAAMIADMLLSLGVKAGDPVAVNFSGSFPGLNASVLCALDAVGARGIVISSVGASTYGANLPDYTWPDMEQELLRRGLIENHSEYFSLGGADDIGKEMPQAVKDEIVTRLTGAGLKFLYYEDFEENLAARMQIYETARSGRKEEEDRTSDTASGDSTAAPVCFINAGGNLLSMGGGTELLSSDNGILLPEQLKDLRNGGGTGLIPGFLQKGVPVIHLLNLKKLLPEYGIPFDPSPLPEPGTGDVYYTEEYSLPLACALTALSLALFFWAAKGLPRRKIPL